LSTAHYGKAGTDIVINMWGYVSVAGLIVITPGADTMVVVKNTLRGGLVHAVRTAAGVCTGLAVWACISAFGLAAILAASGTVFTTIKIAGAAYLIFLGARTLASSRKLDAASTNQSARGIWGQGAITNLGNPKVGVFYTSFLPQFIPAHSQNTLVISLALAGMHIVLSFICLLSYAFLVQRFGDIFQRRRWRQVLEIIIGTVLCGFGVGLTVAAIVED